MTIQEKCVGLEQKAKDSTLTEVHILRAGLRKSQEEIQRHKMSQKFKVRGHLKEKRTANSVR